MNWWACCCECGDCSGVAGYDANITHDYISETTAKQNAVPTNWLAYSADFNVNNPYNFTSLPLRWLMSARYELPGNHHTENTIDPITEKVTYRCVPYEPDDPKYWASPCNLLIPGGSLGGCRQWFEEYTENIKTTYCIRDPEHPDVKDRVFKMPKNGKILTGPIPPVSRWEVGGNVWSQRGHTNWVQAGWMNKSQTLLTDPENADCFTEEVKMFKQMVDCCAKEKGFKSYCDTNTGKNIRTCCSGLDMKLLFNDRPSSFCPRTHPCGHRKLRWKLTEGGSNVQGIDGRLLAYGDFILHENKDNFADSTYTLTLLWKIDDDGFNFIEKDDEFVFWSCYSCFCSFYFAVACSSIEDADYPNIDNFGIPQLFNGNNICGENVELGMPISPSAVTKNTISKNYRTCHNCQ